MNLRTNLVWKSLLFSVSYVGSDLLSLWVLFNDKIEGNSIVFILCGLVVLVTLPVLLVSFPVFYSVGGDYYILITTEVLIVFLVWYITYKYLIKRLARIESSQDKGLNGS